MEPYSPRWWTREYQWRWLFAGYMYYLSDDDIQSPIPDWQYDNIEQVLEMSRQYWTPDFRKRVERGPLKPQAHGVTVQLTEDEIIRALDWSERKKPNTVDGILALAYTGW
jgi:hypothetical protein